MAEAGTNLDLDDLHPLLSRFMNAHEVTAIVQKVERQKVDSTIEFTYPGLRVKSFMDDVDSLGISFFAEPPLIDKIREEIAKFMREQEAKLPAIPKISREERERRIAERKEALDAAWAPIFEALNQAGFAVKSSQELLTGGPQYKAALPILIHWLHQTDNLFVKATLARILIAPWARPAPRKDIIRAFESSFGYNSDKWQIGNVIGQIATKSDLDDLIRIVKDKRHDRSREMIASGLGRIKDERSVDTLLELIADNDLVGHALAGLGKLRSPRAVKAVTACLNHPQGWVRREAKKTLDKTKRF